MRIDSSFVGMESARSYASTTKQTTSFHVTGGLVQNGTNGETNKSFTDLFGTESSEEGNEKSSYTGLDMRYSGVSASRSLTQTSEDKRSIESVRNQCMLYLIKWLYESLYTKKKGGNTSEGNDPYSQMMNQTTAVQSLQTSGYAYSMTNIQTSAQYYHSEEETTDFSTQGTVRTADGREISFNLDLTMSRNFTEYMEANSLQTVVTMTDPLVINLDGNMTELSDQKFEFDIDNDGILDTISQLGSGSGYLALDQNEDGVINDGGELFGPKTGNGFEDLTEYDSDQNGWIDENDPIWKKLMIWTKDENGKDQLYHLADKGVGAICLKQVQTDFNLNSLKTNQVNGQIRQTGVFLYENGTVGTMQNIDVAS